MNVSGEKIKLDRPLVLATKNRGKVSEFQDLFKGFDLEIKSLNDFGSIPPIIEDGETFEDNSVKKAQFTAKVLGLPAIADDSGLTVKALGGKPGVFSARYAGEDSTDEANNFKLLNAMKGIEQREAAFICVLAIAVPQGPALIYGGTCEGLITREISGTKGFGYDPIFYYAPLNKTFAEMSAAEKNGVSHRGRAMAELKRELDKVLIWVRQRLAEEPF